MREGEDFVPLFRKLGGKIDKTVNIFGIVFTWSVVAMASYLTLVTFFSGPLIRVMPENIVSILEIELYEVVWHTPNTLGPWMEALFFPLVFLLATYPLDWRISLRWKRRYGHGNFENIGKRKFLLPISVLMIVLFTSVGFSVFGSQGDLIIDSSIIIGMLILCPSVSKHMTNAVIRNSKLGDKTLWYVVFPIIVLVAWSISRLIMIGYITSGAILWLGIVLGTIGIILFVDETGTNSMRNYLKTLKKLRNNTQSTNAVASDCTVIEAMLRNPATPFFYPPGIDFRTLTNTRYPWEGQSNPETILSLMISHLHKVLFVDVVGVALFVIHPPLIFFVLVVHFFDPAHLARKMSPDFRKKYDALLKRAEAFYNIEYGDDEELIIKKISPKYDDSVVLSLVTSQNSCFCSPERLLGAEFFEEFEMITRNVRELEMIRDQGVIGGPETPLMVIVKEFGMEDFLARHIKRIELKHFPQGKIISEEKVSMDGNQSLEERLNTEILELKERLERHENILNRITTTGDWRYIYSESRTKNALNDIRTCTERLLYSRVEVLGHGHRLPEGQSQTLGPLIQFLNSHKIADLGIIGSKHANVIKEFVNPASHDFTATDGDYLKALDSFVQLVEWHVANPPIGQSIDADN